MSKRVVNKGIKTVGSGYNQNVPKNGSNRPDSKRVDKLLLPNVKLCIKNTKPVSLITFKNKSQIQNDVKKVDNETSTDKTVGKEQELKKLYEQLYLFDLLHRLIKFNIWNKKNVLFLQDFHFQCAGSGGSSKENSMLSNIVSSSYPSSSSTEGAYPGSTVSKNFVLSGKTGSGSGGWKGGSFTHSKSKEGLKATNKDVYKYTKTSRSKSGSGRRLGLLKGLIKSLITNNNVEYRYSLGMDMGDSSSSQGQDEEVELGPESNPLPLLHINDNMFSNMSNYGLKLSRNSLFSSYYHKAGSHRRNNSRNREQAMFENLMRGRTCAGGEYTDARKLLLTMVYLNRYDFLPPQFVNQILEKYGHLFDTPNLPAEEQQQPIEVVE